MQLLCWFFYFAVLFSATFTKKLPSYLEPCKKSSKDLGGCIIKNIEILKPRLGKGIPELSLPPFDPLTLSEAHLNTNGGFLAGFKDVKIQHLDNFIIKKLKFNLDNLELEINVDFPLLIITSVYTVKGKILVVEVNSTGEAYGNYSTVSTHVIGRGLLTDKNGKKHIKIDNSEVDLKVAHAYLYFDKIFGDNEELNEHSNRLLNENIKSVLEEFLPVAGGLIKEVFIGIANELFNKYSFDELFPIS